MFYRQQQKIKRTSKLLAILSKYGFKELLYRLQPANTNISEDDAVDTQINVYTRIRMALEELGPSFIKLGQALSSRNDMLPEALIKELQLLQDSVEAADIDIDTILEAEFGNAYFNNFQNIDKQPIASASIAQVYKATLSDGQTVILKIKRPNIDEIIESDLMIIKDLAALLTKSFEFANALNLQQAVNAFEQSLLAELSLVKERENIERFAQNFKGNSTLLVPKVYPYLSNNNVICMDFIDGAKVTNMDFLKLHQINPEKLTEKILNLYLAQILEHGFYHADPHPGNIMVTSEGKIAFIDMGAMGTIYPADQAMLEDIIINVIFKNVPKLIQILKKMAIKFEIKDEQKLESDLKDILHHIDSSNLDKLDIKILFEKFKGILFENRIIMPDYFVILARSLALIESVGRTLYPNMNVVKSVEPYIKKVLLKRLNPKYILEKGLPELLNLGQDALQIPVEIRSIIQKLNEGNFIIKTQNTGNQNINTQNYKLILLLCFSILIAAAMIAIAIFSINVENKTFFYTSATGLLLITIVGIITFFPRK